MSRSESGTGTFLTRSHMRSAELEEHVVGDES